MIVSLITLILILLPIAYWFMLALAAIRMPSRRSRLTRKPVTRFAITIPAHDEASVIGATVSRLRNLDYPSDMYAIHIVADHCTDETGRLAQEAGAVVHERQDGPRTGKGAALAWLFERMLTEPYDAVVVFDSDTQVEPDFLRVMDARLAEESQVIQGQHIIRNPESGWFPALTWAMFLIDNRFQNLGRSNLGWSAKNMGDSICFRADILRNLGWGEGLTEDYQLRQRLLLAGIKISYEPRAKGYGEAPRTWAQARAQRARWLRGTQTASQQLARQLLKAAIKHRDLAILDGALQAYLPSFSTLTVIGVLALLAQLLLNKVFLPPLIAPSLIYAWIGVCVALFVYPLFGLALERAPARAYFVILTGPLFILWRTALAITSRYSRRPAIWVRTSHGETK
ncbi:MAG TPA: glycosyltransferase family 2 protein [Anaerolineales bacterium]|nr:glycosyltransferase family 2 protein [Anaerolineales bacterium]